MLGGRPRCPLFPYTTLFRSRRPPSHRSARPSSSCGRCMITTSTSASAASACVTSTALAGHSHVCARPRPSGPRSEEHTSELQSRIELLCRLLLVEKQIDLYI